MCIKQAPTLPRSPHPSPPPKESCSPEGRGNRVVNGLCVVVAGSCHLEPPGGSIHWTSAGGPCAAPFSGMGVGGTPAQQPTFLTVGLPVFHVEEAVPEGLFAGCADEAAGVPRLPQGVHHLLREGAHSGQEPVGSASPLPPKQQARPTERPAAGSSPAALAGPGCACSRHCEASLEEVLLVAALFPKGGPGSRPRVGAGKVGGEDITCFAEAPPPLGAVSQGGAQVHWLPSSLVANQLPSRTRVELPSL